MSKKMDKVEPTRSESAGAEDRVSVIHMKGSQAYRDWLNGISKKTMIPATSIARAGIADWALKHGHPAPPEI